MKTARRIAPTLLNRLTIPCFRKMLLMLALQWKLAAQEEASKQPTERS